MYERTVGAAVAYLVDDDILPAAHRELAVRTLGRALHDALLLFEGLIVVVSYVFDCCQLVDIPKRDACLLDFQDFDGLEINPNVELLLIRTGYERLRGEAAYWNNNPGLAPGLAEYFRIHFPRLRCIGFDFISVTSWKYRAEGRLAHKAFLAPENGEREIWCMEDMSLAEAHGDLEQVIVAPLLVEDGNGAAVTVIAKIK